MNCIIVDDEPLAREAMKLLIEESSNLQLIGSFNLSLIHISEPTRP